MRIMVVGATGTIGTSVCEAMEAAGHDVVRVGHTSGEHHVDLKDPVSIDALYGAVGTVDAVVCCAGSARFGSLQELDEEAYLASVRDKLMGQVNLVRSGLDRVSPGGSFTLTTGTLSQEPTPGTVVVALVGGALEAWAKAAALDLEDHRVNVVSPPSVRESLEAMGMDPSSGTPAAEVARGYVRAVEGDMSGRTLYVDR